MSSNSFEMCRAWLTLEIHLSCRTSAAKFNLSHLKFTCSNKPPQYHQIMQSYNLLAALNKEWCFCLLYIYLWNTSTWRQTQAHRLKLPWLGDINEPTTINFTLAKQPQTLITHAVIGPHIRQAQLVSNFRTVIWEKWHVKKWRINSRFQYASVYLSCWASTWDDLLILHAKPFMPDKH